MLYINKLKIKIKIYEIINYVNFKYSLNIFYFYIQYFFKIYKYKKYNFIFFIINILN